MGVCFGKERIGGGGGGFVLGTGALDVMMIMSKKHSSGSYVYPSCSFYCPYGVSAPLFGPCGCVSDLVFKKRKCKRGVVF